MIEHDQDLLETDLATVCGNSSAMTCWLAFGRLLGTLLAHMAEGDGYALESGIKITQEYVREVADRYHAAKRLDVALTAFRHAAAPPKEVPK